MPTPTKKVIKVTGGKYLQYSIDPLTLSRIHHANHVAKLMGIETSQSAIVRAAVKFYLDHLDSNGFFTLRAVTPQKRDIRWYATSLAVKATIRACGR